ncbi:hypothetical protein BGW80DRAFT_1252243 [Lactifluus volemus]|nr:hypothetical protein BGW80DRAFT_1252243 [Lactifluus volemus]
MAVIPVTSLAQFNSVCTISHRTPRLVWLRTDQHGSRRLYLLLGVLVWPCRGMTPIFNGVADSGSYPGVDFYRVDIDHVHDVVENVGGQTIPGFYAYQRGHKLGEIIGAHPAGFQLCRIYASVCIMSKDELFRKV